LPKGLKNLQFTLVSLYKLSSKPMDMLRQQGNIHNELGVLHINQTGCMYKLCTCNRRYNKYLLFIDQKIIHFVARLLNLRNVTTLSTHSLTHLKSGFKAFETVHDEANLTLLHSNTSRLMRFCVHIHGKQYKKALMCYQKALLVLDDTTTNSNVRHNYMGFFDNIAPKNYAIAGLFYN